MHEKVNILMVDDQPSKLLTYESALQELGENLIKAHLASEAFGHLLKTEFAVILMDVNMPEQDGFEAADMIRAHPRFQDIAIIFISGVLRTDMDRLRGYEHGAVDYLTVPIIPEVLRAKVKVFADLHRKTRQLETLNREMHALSIAMIKLRDEERRRLARELHDGLGQELSAAKMISDTILRVNQLPQAKELATEVIELIRNVMRQVRSISHLLHPPLLEETGLHTALHSYVDGLTKRSGIETLIELRPPDFPRLAPELELTIFRVVQEALTNVFRHSEARTARVSLEVEDAKVIVKVRDDGNGISEDIAKFRSGRVGVGFSGMRQRVRDIGGELLLENANPGTLVEAIFPQAVASSVADRALPTTTA